MEAVAENQLPIWRSMAILPLLAVMLKCAGVTFSSDQNIAFGDMLAGSNGVSPAARVMDYCTFVLLLALIVPCYRSIVKAYHDNMVLTVLVVLAPLSIFWSQDPVLTTKNSLWLILTVSLALFIAKTMSAQQQMQLIMATGAAAGVLTIAAVFMFPSIGLDRLHDNVWQGLFTSKNHLGRIALYFLTPAVHYSASTKGALWFKRSYIVLMLLLIVMSGSRSAWIYTILYLLLASVMVLANKVTQRQRLLVVTAIAMTGAAAALIAIVNLNTLLGLVGRDATFSSRTVIWQVLMQSVEKRPLLGFGYQAFWAGTSSEAMNALMVIYARIRFLASYAHSGYLAVLLENGAVGLALIIILSLQAGKSAIVCFRTSHDSSVHWYIGLIVLTLAYNFDEVIFMLPSYLPWMMFILACVMLRQEATCLRTADLA